MFGANRETIVTFQPAIEKYNERPTLIHMSRIQF